MVLAQDHQDHPDNQPGDRPNGHQDGRGHLHEAHLEGGLRFGEGLGQGILEDGVNLGGHRGGQLWPGHLDQEPACLIGGLRRLLQGLVEVIPVEKQQGLIGAGYCPV